MAPSSGARRPLTVLGGSLVLFCAAYVLKAPANATAGYHVAMILMTLGTWFVALAAISLIVSALARRVRTLWLPLFAWLFLAATLFELAVAAYSEFIVEPKVREVLEAMMDGE